eukprot:3843631-Rhodomonas_salina.1
MSLRSTRVPLRACIFAALQLSALLKQTLGSQYADGETQCSGAMDLKAGTISGKVLPPPTPTHPPTPLLLCEIKDVLHTVCQLQQGEEGFYVPSTEATLLCDDARYWSRLCGYAMVCGTELGDGCYALMCGNALRIRCVTHTFRLKLHRSSATERVGTLYRPTSALRYARGNGCNETALIGDKHQSGIYTAQDTKVNDTEDRMHTYAARAALIGARERRLQLLITCIVKKQ